MGRLGQLVSEASSIRASRSSGTRIWIVVEPATRTFRCSYTLSTHALAAADCPYTL